MGICKFCNFSTSAIIDEMASGRWQDLNIMVNMCSGLSLVCISFDKLESPHGTVRRGAWPFSLNIIYPDFCRRLEEVAIASFSYDIKSIRTFRTLFNSFLAILKLLNLISSNLLYASAIS